MKRINLILAVMLLCAGLYGQELIKFSENGKYGFRNTEGHVLVRAEYDWANDFSEGLALVKTEGKWGYIDKAGEMIIPAKYDWGDDFSDGLAKVSVRFKYGYVDTSGKEVIPLKYDKVEGFSEGLARVESDGKYGYMNKTEGRLSRSNIAGPMIFPMVWQRWPQGLKRAILIR
ncbi:MAG: WG repeat-containing protein [Prevotellaceae bacterium]|jgi:regulation of enolase protein 1 (concanavalin A-like superfamily)|nr:WG repeat-containing protein [Prevotellaceae bacterium]